MNAFLPLQNKPNSFAILSNPIKLSIELPHIGES